MNFKSFSFLVILKKHTFSIIFSFSSWSISSCTISKISLQDLFEMPCISLEELSTPLVVDYIKEKQYDDSVIPHHEVQKLVDEFLFPSGSNVSYLMEFCNIFQTAYT